VTILAIDPGDTHSAFAEIEDDTRRPLRVGKVSNGDLLKDLRFSVQAYNLAGDAILTCPDRVAIEMISSYGMPVGQEIFDTCIWIGRFIEVAPAWPQLVPRRDVKLHHCEDSRAKDSNVAQALIDRFTPGARHRGKGTRTEPGWFHGFHHDVWQAYALAVYVADTAPLSREDATP
jgi:hypothetical protein